jgi:hypothetical protein
MLILDTADIPRTDRADAFRAAMQASVLCRVDYRERADRGAPVIGLSFQARGRAEFAQLGHEQFRR